MVEKISEQQRPVQVTSTTIAPRLSSFQALTIVITLVVTASVSFLGGIVYERQQGLAYSEEFEIFWEAWNYIDEEFYTEPPSVTDRVYGGISGIITSLNDPFTSVSKPVQAVQNREVIEGKFGGIGASVGINENQEPFIVAVLEDACIPTTPAARAGLQANDIIRAVDGIAVQGKTLNEVVDMVKGHEGTEVVLTIHRPSEDNTFDVPIRREIIEQITVTDRMYEDVGYLGLSIFNAVATKQMECKLETMLNQNPRAIILDLRQNPGGLLNEAVSIGDLFLNKGVLVSQRDRDGNQEDLFTEDGEIGEEVPLIVLIDHGSASASEVVAGALQDRERAILIGQTSYGKGSVQNVHILSDGGELRVTSAAWYTPDGRRIHGIGLEPDIFVEGEAVVDGVDTYVQSALNYIHENIASTDEPTAVVPTQRQSYLPAITQHEVMDV